MLNSNMLHNIQSALTTCVLHVAMYCHYVWVRLVNTTNWTCSPNFARTFCKHYFYAFLSSIRACLFAPLWIKSSFNIVNGIKIKLFNSVPRKLPSYAPVLFSLMRCHGNYSVEGNTPIAVRTLGASNKHTNGHRLMRQNGRRVGKSIDYVTQRKWWRR